VPPGEELPPGFVFRNQAPPTGYNSGMTTFLQSRGVAVPDFSGVHVRDRGSGVNRFSPPHWNFIGQTEMYGPNPYFDPLDYNNWTNGVPPFCMVSPKHFLGCRHFIGPGNTGNITVRLIKKDGSGILWKEGQLISSFGDANLYRLLVPLTPEEQQQVNCYEILDFRRIPAGTLLWRNDPNGRYVAYITTGTAYYTEDGILMPPPTNAYQDASGEFPVPEPYTTTRITGVLRSYDATPPSALWYGDSGSPLLATANGQTYIYGFANGISYGGFEGGSAITQWLISQLGTDGVPKSLVDLGSPIPQYTAPVASPKLYKSGFLEEAEANSLPFITDNPNGNPPIISVKFSGEYTVSSGEQVYINNVRMGPSLFGSEPMFSCNVYVGDRLLIRNSDFNRSVVFLIGRYTHLSLTLDSGRLNLSVVYIDKDFISSPIDNFYLSPFCLEPHAGQVFLTVGGSNISTGLLTFSPGYNYELAYTVADSPSVDFAVTVGAGDGLQPCDDPIDVPSYLRSMNGIRPNDRGDIKLQAPPSDCVSVDSTYSALQGGKIKLDSHCAPCCRCTDYESSSDYIKGVAVKYNELIKQYNALVSTYNNIAANFEDSLQSCATEGRLNTRFRMWPQQNFKVQVQAMVENNTKKPVIMKKLKLDLDLRLYNDISAVDPDTGATYTMSAGSYVTSVPLEDASYLYYKNLNPVSKGFTFTVPQPGSLRFEVDLTQSGMPVPAGSGGQSPYIIPPCTGYAMITGGFVIVDPLFRKIVSLNYRSGLAVKSTLYFKYTGTAENQDPCTSPQEAERTLVPPGGVDRPLTVKPNKSSVNPCDSVQPSTISQDSNNAFNLELPQVVYGAGSLTIVYKLLTDNGWVEGSSTTLPITMAAEGSQKILIGAIPDTLGSGNWQVVASYAPGTNPSQRLYTLCVRSETPGTETPILVAPFQVGKAFTI
jgi:hypothetical protein